ncbi:carbon starvation CstA family protein [Brevibacterium litoralis]|uniref:carbon starvation CstA family protein n=1 Tax=Brevibacterium litoralis TaxID=3138935 RepID=UPI0032EE8BA8
MNSLLLLIIGLAILAFGYLVYSKFLSGRVFRLDPAHRTPAHEFEDGVDYMPTNKFVLWGHHFTSVAGAAPIVGPAVAVIWGWVPAFLWVTLGTVFFAGMHDFGALWASQRNKGKSMGSLAERYIGKRGSYLFLVVMFVLLVMVIGAFAVVIKNLLIGTPTAVIPAWGAIPVAVLVGLAVYKLKWNLGLVTVLGVVALYALILIGDANPIVIPESGILGMAPGTFWIVTLLVYSTIASLLPVWVLLQPRDYINGVQLFVGLIILFVSIAIAHPQIVAPAWNSTPPEATPSLVPLLFVTIACGAISGFHGMVSSGTTSKQLDKEPDARFVGYFGSVGEGLLALGTIISVTAGFRTLAEWESVYQAFNDGGVNAFIEGGGALVNSGLGLPVGLASTVLATMAVLFAATTLDTAFRLFRFVIQEVGETVNVRVNKWVATVIVVVLSCALIFSQGVDGSGGLAIWPLFGTSNQLLASLTLGILAVMLIRLKRNPWPALVPLALVFTMSFWAAIDQLGSLATAGDWTLLIIDIVIIVASVWVAIEAFVAMARARNDDSGDENFPESLPRRDDAKV